VADGSVVCGMSAVTPAASTPGLSDREKKSRPLDLFFFSQRLNLAWPSLCRWGNPFSSAFLGMRPNMDSIPISFRFYGVNVL